MNTEYYDSIKDYRITEYSSLQPIMITKELIEDVSNNFKIIWRYEKSSN